LFWLGSVLPFRMSVMTYAACGVVGCVTVGPLSVEDGTALPLASWIERIMDRSTSAPPSAMAP